MKKIFVLCKKLGVQLSAMHLPGLENSHADYLSRLYPQHKWQVAHHTFLDLDHCWGPHSINHLATAANKLLPQFNSRFWEPGLEAIDATVQDWRGKTNWAAPPIALIPRVVRLIHKQEATATLIAPIWPGKLWFQELLSGTRDMETSQLTQHVLLSAG